MNMPVESRSIHPPVRLSQVAHNARERGRKRKCKREKKYQQNRHESIPLIYWLAGKLKRKNGESL
jgi:hypothetical protein